MNPPASSNAKGVGRLVRRARNTVKRYAGRTEPKLVRRLERAQAILFYHTLSK
jgi:hypothetical protein